MVSLRPTARMSGCVLGAGETTTFTPTQSGGGGSKTYTLTITSADLVILDSSQSSTYNKYKGDQTFTAIASDDSELSVVVNITDVMPATGVNAGKIQLKGGSAVLYNKTDLGAITSVIVADSVSGITTNIGTSENPSSNSGSGGYFKITKGSSAGYTSSITIVFTK